MKKDRQLSVIRHDRKPSGKNFEELVQISQQKASFNLKPEPDASMKLTFDISSLKILKKMFLNG
jgi:hypothetical protein